MIIQNFLEKIKSNINICALKETCDEQDILKLCNYAVENNVHSICVPVNFISAAWKWVEKNNIKVGCCINTPFGQGSVNDIFKETKKAISSGAEIIELILPYKDFCEGNLNELEDVITSCKEASEKRTMIKGIIETGYLKSASKIQSFINCIIKMKLGCIKTASGFYTKLSSIEEINAVIDKIDSLNQNIKIDVMPEPFSKDKFSNYENSLRLSEKIKGKDWASNNITYSVSFENFIKMISC